LSTISRVEVSDTRLDIYDHEKRFKNAKNNLELCKKTLAANKRSILDFVQHLLTCGVSKARATKYLLHLHTLSKTTRKPFSNFVRKDVEQLVGWISARFGNPQESGEQS